MHYFHNLSSASGGFAPDPHRGLHSWTPLGDFCPETHNLPTPWKNSAGARGDTISYRTVWHQRWWRHWVRLCESSFLLLEYSVERLIEYSSTQLIWEVAINYRVVQNRRTHSSISL